LRTDGRHRCRGNLLSGFGLASYKRPAGGSDGLKENVVMVAQLWFVLLMLAIVMLSPRASHHFVET
jgi:hypothetical protein